MTKGYNFLLFWIFLLFPLYFERKDWQLNGKVKRCRLITDGYVLQLSGEFSAHKISEDKLWSAVSEVQKSTDFLSNALKDLLTERPAKDE